MLGLMQISEYVGEIITNGISSVRNTVVSNIATEEVSFIGDLLQDHTLKGLTVWHTLDGATFLVGSNLVLLELKGVNKQYRTYVGDATVTLGINSYSITELSWAPGQVALTPSSLTVAIRDITSSAVTTLYYKTTPASVSLSCSELMADELITTSVKKHFEYTFNPTVVDSCREFIKYKLLQENCI
jgi:hypothetical protein